MQVFPWPLYLYINIYSGIAHFLDQLKDSGWLQSRCQLVFTFSVLTSWNTNLCFSAKDPRQTCARPAWQAVAPLWLFSFPPVLVALVSTYITKTVVRLKSAAASHHGARRLWAPSSTWGHFTSNLKVNLLEKKRVEFIKDLRSQMSSAYPFTRSLGSRSCSF